MTFTDWSEVVRFEVEEDPAGLANVIDNPSGELGGSGWLTPVAGSTIAGKRDEFGVFGLLYVGADAASNYFLSEPFPIAAGWWAAASWYARMAAVVGTSTHRVRFDWLTAAMAANGSSAWTTSTEYDGESQVAPKQAPASTAYAQLRFEFAEIGGTFPSTEGMGGWVRRVTVAAAATSAELGTIRTNLIPNPSFETNTTGWAVGTGCTLARSTAMADYGSASLAITGTGAALSEVRTLIGTSGIPVTAGKNYTVQFVAAAATVPRTTRVGVMWYRSTGALISTTTVDGPADNTTGWTPVTGTFRAPAGATRMAVRCGVAAAAAGEVHRIDAVCVEVGEVAGEYFDGSLVDGGTVTFDWTGTAHSSSSRMIDTNLAYIEPVTYGDILGDVSEVAVTREELNVGTLGLTVVNPLLDPSVETLLRPGRRFRLMAYNPPAETFEPLITGRISTAKVDYYPLGKAGRTARVTLTGVDNVTALANAKRPESVGTIDELRYVLEGAGVPWNVNGSSQQLASATVVVRNDNTTALDQIALARDTERGYAWVDRWGVLQAWSDLATNPETPTEVVPNGTFDANVNLWNAGTWNTIAWEAGTLKITSTDTLLSTRTATPTQFGRVPVEGGQRVVASAKVRSATTVREPWMILTFVDDVPNIISQEIYSGTGSTSFVTIGGEVVVPYGATEMAIVVGVNDVDVVGEVHYIDDVSVVLTPPDPWQLTDEVYNPDIVVDYDTARTINSVSVLRQWTHATQGAQGTLYGPYTDDDSIAEWGRQHVEINVAGTPAASIPAYAAAVLAANAQPERKCQSVTVPIEDETALAFAFIDLYDAVRVVNAETNLDAVMRVTEVSHTLVADERRGGRWLLRLGFATEGGVATPTQQPPLKGALATAPNGTLDHYTSGSTTSLANNTWEFVPSFSRAVTNPGYFTGPSSGTLTCQVAGTYLVNLSVGMASNGTGRRGVRLMHNGTEVRRVDVGAGGLVSVEVAHALRLEVGDTLTAQTLQSSGGALALAANPGHHWQLIRTAD